MNILRKIYRQYVLHRYAIRHSLWHETIEKITITQRLTAVELAHLRTLVTLFLHSKTITGATDLEITDKMKLCIAIQSCLLVLHLDLDYLDGWTQVIVYPGEFKISRDVTDSIGLVHHEENVLMGESWSKGPVILSWQSIEEDLAEPHKGHNVIIHEMAHKLDMLNGSVDGLPPLSSRLKVNEWIDDLTKVYEHLNQRLERHHSCEINPYAATSPGEFFAVISEYFFSAPEILNAYFPILYQELKSFYYQDTLIHASSK